MVFFLNDDDNDILKIYNNDNDNDPRSVIRIIITKDYWSFFW